jgi:hypothetical protein
MHHNHHLKHKQIIILGKTFNCFPLNVKEFVFQILVRCWTQRKNKKECKISMFSLNYYTQMAVTSNINENYEIDFYNGTFI